MIQSFKCKQTEGLFNGFFAKKLPADIQRIAQRKLKHIDSAITLDDLRIPPGNNLEALKENRKGQHSIRINKQWRICFMWEAGNAYDVETLDYH